MNPNIENAIIAAVEQNFAEQIAFTSRLVSSASQRGEEQEAQDIMRKALAERDFDIDSWQINIDDIAHLPGFSPVKGPYDDAVNVVGTLQNNPGAGRSLILNGHIDVVPVGPLDMWDNAPYDAFVKDGWLHGRGAGDMKAGLVANLFALDAIKSAGFVPDGKVIFQSVVEEECTGNGALACLQRGYKADAVLIPEPFEEKLTTAQVGVLWFQVHLKGIPMHIAYAGPGANPIEGASPIFEALRAMEKRWNAPERRHPEYKDYDHALNLNIGIVKGGDWASSVPSWCSIDFRMGLFPGQDMEASKQEVLDVIQEAAKANAFLRENPPEVEFIGFQAEGYALADDTSSHALEASDILTKYHEMIVGKPIERRPETATTDARFFGLYGDTPAFVYGPDAIGIHGFNERVDLESVKRVTKTTALFIAEWCGLRPL